MKRFLKWSAIVLCSVVVVALALIYGVSEYRLRERFDAPATAIQIPTDSMSLAQGRHVFETRGCTGCHGEGLWGKVFFDEPWLARLVAPNVPKAIRGYSDRDLARLLRHGVRPNGRGVAVMPSSMFYHLDDADLLSLIAYLRTIPAKETPLPTTEMRILARLGLVLGKYNLEPTQIVHDAPRIASGPDAAARGQYLAQTSCTECHGQKLEGGVDTPALSIVAAYSPAEFAKLMREGVPKDGRKLELMRETARGRFSHFDDEELASLHAYLSRPMTAAAPANR